VEGKLPEHPVSILFLGFVSGKDVVSGLVLCGRLSHITLVYSSDYRVAKTENPSA